MYHTYISIKHTLRKKMIISFKLTFNYVVMYIFISTYVLFIYVSFGGWGKVYVCMSTSTYGGQKGCQIP